MLNTKFSNPRTSPKCRENIERLLDHNQISEKKRFWIIKSSNEIRSYFQKYLHKVYIIITKNYTTLGTLHQIHSIITHVLQGCSAHKIIGTVDTCLLKVSDKVSVLQQQLQLSMCKKTER